MKKAISLILALTLVMGLSVSAFAADVAVEGNPNLDIEADYKDQVITEQPVYSHNVTWDKKPTLTYDAGEVTYTWNPKTHEYEKTTNREAGWTADNAEFTLTVTNNSNRAVTFTATYNPDNSGSVKTKMEWTTSTITLNSAAPADYTGTGEEQTGTLSGKVTVTEGTPTGKVSVGTITVTITH